MTVKIAAAGICLLLSGCATDQVPPPELTAEAQPAAPKTSMQVLRDWAPAAGLQTEELFTEPGGSKSARIKRLEEATQQSRTDTDTLALAVTNLSSGQSDLRSRVERLEKLTGGLEAQQRAEQAAAEEAAKYAALVSAFNIQERPAATQIVLDLTGKTNAAAELSKDGKMLNIKLPATGWTAPRDWAPEFSPLIASYKAVPASDGQAVNVALNFPAKILKQELLPPSNGAGWKLSIDLQSSKVHFLKMK
ncbi:MAG: hypothetical protein EP349_01680 [Alphaproteobacteria bacterium]|nr:MAG: hypothetical protein EP349_01680 [Alphaproteobacteria bacterium]